MRNWVDLTGEIVLRCLDEHSGLTFFELEDALGIERAGSGHMAVMECVRRLHSAKLIVAVSCDGDVVPVAETDDDYYSLMYRNMRAGSKLHSSPLWMSVQRELKMSYYGGKEPEGEYSFLATPIFGKPNSAVSASDIFVMMPFSTALTPIYRDVLCGVARDLNLSISRADELFGSRSIMSDIWSLIIGCGVTVADLTDKNPNVFYELGIAHAVGKHVILIAQSLDDVPFDLRHMRTVIYENTGSGLASLSTVLKKHISSVLQLY